MEWNEVKTNQHGWVESAELLPKEKKEVLLRMKSKGGGIPDPIVVGYLKYAAGDRDSPEFIVPGHGGQVVAWCDCLPEKFIWPHGPNG